MSNTVIAGLRIYNRTDKVLSPIVNGKSFLIPASVPGGVPGHVDTTVGYGKDLLKALGSAVTIDIFEVPGQEAKRKSIVDIAAVLPKLTGTELVGVIRYLSSATIPAAELKGRSEDDLRSIVNHLAVYGLTNFTLPPKVEDKGKDK